MKPKSAFTLIELLVIVTILSLLLAVLVQFAGCSSSDGARVGVVTKFSHKGLFSSTKSWEGELVLIGARTKRDSEGNTGVVANTWEFSVLDSKVIEKIKTLQDNGHRAKLVYEQTFGHNPLRRETSYVVTDAIDLDAAER